MKFENKHQIYIIETCTKNCSDRNKFRGTSSTPIWSKLRVLRQITHKYIHNSTKLGN